MHEIANYTTNSNFSTFLLRTFSEWVELNFTLSTRIQLQVHMIVTVWSIIIYELIGVDSLSSDLIVDPSIRSVVIWVESFN